MYFLIDTVMYMLVCILLSSLLETKISIRCKQKVADAKLKRLENIQRQEKEQEDRLEAIREKLAAGIARRNAELRNKQLRSLAACRWCAARRIQIWWVNMKSYENIVLFCCSNYN